MIEITNLPSWKPNCNPMRENLTLMGNQVATNVFILTPAHRSERTSYIELINTETGERIKINFDPDPDCELCKIRNGHEVANRRFCAICEARIVEDGTYCDGMAVKYDEIPAGLYEGR